MPRHRPKIAVSVSSSLPCSMHQVPINRSMVAEGDAAPSQAAEIARRPHRDLVCVI
jgi:hypothetical protein